MELRIDMEEISKELNIEIQTVRYYMSEELITLQEDMVTGQLFIDETNLELLETVILLRECSVSIGDIRQLMKNYSDEQLKVLLKEALSDIEEELSALSRLKLDIKSRLDR